MQLNREKLIGAARAGIDRAHAQQDEWDRKVTAVELAYEESWVKYKLPQWREFRDVLTKALRTGGHITVDMVPVSSDYGSLKGPVYKPFNRGRVNRSQQWEADHQFGRRPVPAIDQFESLISFLEAVEDDTVSTTQLERAGFRNLNKLFTAAANGFWY